jgi:protein-disulfide isomerase
VNVSYKCFWQGTQEDPMKSTAIRSIILAAITCVAVGILATTHAAAQTSSVPDASAIDKKVEAYLRELYAWGPSFKLTFSPLKESPIPGLYELTVGVTAEGQTDSAQFYVTKDGKYLMRTELEDMNADPLAEARKQITTEGDPFKGPVNAKVVVVEFADFECPSCKQLDTILRATLPNFPQIKLVYKDFPLTQIHPWAMTAALAGRCVYKLKPDAFWKFHDLLFDGQETISPENVWDRLGEYATQSGVDAGGMRACMADSETKQIVDKSVSEGLALHIANTPTIFVDGRRIIGPDGQTLDQFIRYDLLTIAPTASGAIQPVPRSPAADPASVTTATTAHH